jgi:capsular polysaccharide biosynthesis protein
VPALPVWPAGLVVVTGLIAACGSGAGAAFIADRLDPALRTPEEVLTCLDLPVLASLPAASRRQLSA